LLAQLVGEVVAAVGDLRVDSLDAEQRPCAPFTSTLAAANKPLGAAERRLKAAIVLRTLDELSVAGGKEVIQAHVDANGGFDRTLGWWLPLIVDENACEPISGAAGHGQSARIVVAWLEAANADQPNTHYAHTAILHDIAAARNRETVISRR
jgi:hypothetical protein